MRVFLCEKPSQGKDIARVLGAVQRGNGCYSGAGVVVTWCIGHRAPGTTARCRLTTASSRRWSPPTYRP